MKKSTKAALMSALLFPGMGHIYLKKYVPGVSLICISLYAFYFYASKSIEKAFELTEKIRSGVIPLNVTGITEMVEQNTTAAEAHLLNIATTALVICWLVGIIDSYRIGTRFK